MVEWHKKELWIVDLDGTLVDPTNSLENAWNQVFRLFDKEIHEFDYRSYVGLPLDKVLNIAGFSNHEMTSAAAAFNEYMKSFEHLLIPYPGSSEFMNFLQKSATRTAIFTSKPRERAEGVLSRFGWHVDKLMAAEDSEEVGRKPSPNVPIELCQFFQVSREDCVFFGDSLYDYESANAAGIDFLLAKWGFSEGVDANYEVKDLYQLVLQLQCPND